ncbi:amino acid ABC transporter permease [Mesorhizobium sp. LMG 17147]|uniref:amino acid ABC transporter permease n=1 Tax=Mesorhizobium sp. LMG 17147 TaxID=2963091 RepID=UPI0020C990F0|nr:amino acid ABC transporter permease [Mesorhizobium sp. LMG 17147]MCP9234213.1 amino acid ABC transporter permease [Mesorhizobium sp. LMG 17147]
MAHLQVMIDSLPTLLIGAKLTVLLAVISYALALLLGTLIAVGRLSNNRIISFFCAIYVDFFRGTPLLVQIFMVYFGIPSLLQDFGIPFRFDRFYAAVLTLSLYIAAYVSEDLRTGVTSLGTGQWDAAHALGLRPLYVWTLVILPQAFRRALPSLGNEAVGIIKDTSLVAIIGYEELFRKGQLIVAETYQPFEIYVVVSAIYLILTMLTSSLNRYLESKFKK